jgi:uncharacterized protein
MLKKIIFSISLFAAPIVLNGQTQAQRVLVRNTGTVNDKQSIAIKWYSKEIYYSEGVNLYRREEYQREWKKLNAEPLKKKEQLLADEYDKDPDLNFFVPLINESNKEDLQGLFLINILVKSFQSESFSRFLGIHFEDSTVMPGKTYIYQVKKINLGTEVFLGESTAIIAGPETIEEAPREIAIQADTLNIKIRWKVEEQRFYAANIYRTQNDEWELVNKTPIMISKSRDSLGHLRYPQIFFTDDSLQPGIYSYQLAGIDFFGKETKRSQTIKVELKDLIPPPPPENLNDSIDNLDVVLRWTNPVSTDIAGINIYRSVKSHGPFEKLNSSLLPPATFIYKDQVQHAGPYYYYVSSVDAGGNESASSAIFTEVHDIIPPARPSGLIARPDTGAIILSWKENKEGDLSGYLVYRSIQKNDRHFALLNTVPIKQTSFRDNLPKNARNTFFYKIIAIDSSYNKSPGSDLANARMPDIIPPVKPYLKNLTSDDHHIIIRWIPNKDEDLKDYHIYRSNEEGIFLKLNQTMLTGAIDSFIDRNVGAGIRYSYYITAVDSAGNQSLPSNILLGFNNFSLIKKGPQDLKITYRAEKKEVRLSWKQENSENISGFVIYRKDNESEAMVPLGSNAGSPEYSDKSILPGNTYYYQVRVYDRSGAISKSEIIKISTK